MDEKPLPVTDSVFFPYYVNQNRLLDIYAILNRGFSEYEEIKEESSSGKSSSKRGGAGVGFKIFKLGIAAEAEFNKNSENSNSKESKLVQTTTSMLSMVVDQLSQHKFLKEILMSQPGDFVCIPVNLKINSIKGLVDEAIEITELSQKMQEVGGTKLKGSNNANSASLKKIGAVTKELFSAEEIVSENEAYAVIGTITDQNLYQAIRQDIIDIDLTCLAQIKRVFPDGTQLMKNTVFTKIMDTASKEALIKSVAALNSGPIKCDSVAIMEISGKPVYQLEVVALYQESHPSV